MLKPTAAPKPPVVRRLQSAAGFSLLEVILSIAIVTMVVTFLTTLAVTANQNAGISRDYSQADLFVRQGSEAIRNLRDNQGWDGLLSYDARTPLPASTGSQFDKGRYYSLSGSGVLNYEADFSVVQTTATLCTTAGGQTPYAVSWAGVSSQYYRVIALSLSSAQTEVRVQSAVCFKQGHSSLYSPDVSETILSDWR